MPSLLAYPSLIQPSAILSIEIRNNHRRSPGALRMRLLVILRMARVHSGYYQSIKKNRFPMFPRSFQKVINNSYARSSNLKRHVYIPSLIKLFFFNVGVTSLCFTRAWVGTSGNNQQTGLPKDKVV